MILIENYRIRLDEILFYYPIQSQPNFFNIKIIFKHDKRELLICLDNEELRDSYIEDLDKLFLGEYWNKI